MAGVEGSVIYGDRIIFPEGTKKEAVGTFCQSCLLNVSCHGFDSKGFAEVDKPRDINYGDELDEYIASNASCLK